MTIAGYLGHIVTGKKAEYISAKHQKVGLSWLKAFDSDNLHHALILLEAACAAKKLTYDKAYLSHWLKSDSYSLESSLDSTLMAILAKTKAVHHLNRSVTQLKFIDLFCGIGGFHLALAPHASCVFASDIDESSQYAYFMNYGLWPFGDIHTTKSYIPNHDILCGGFPCQPFSAAGKRLGFSDSRGTLFFEICTIIESNRPRVVFLENVRNLYTHDSGNTFKVILRSLNDLGYKVYHQILNAKDFGLPQNRERIYIVAFRDHVDFTFPTPTHTKTRVGDILDPTVSQKYTISDKLWAGHRRRAISHKSEHKGFTYSVFSPDAQYTRTLTARYGKDGKEILISQAQNPRRLSPRECARLQGFPDSFKIVSSDSASYRQFGNSVPVKVVAAIADQIVRTISQSNIDKP